MVTALRKYELLHKFGWNLNWDTVQDITYRDAMILRYCIEAENESIENKTHSNPKGAKLASIQGMKLGVNG